VPNPATRIATGQQRDRGPGIMTSTSAATSIATGERRASSRLVVWCDRNFKWLLVMPAAALIAALSIYPLLFSIWISFVNYDFSVPGHDFVGLGNFRQIVFDPIARWSLVVTALLTTCDVVIEFLLGLGLALIMARSFRGRGVVLSVLIVPLFISPVIVGQVWALLLQRPFGPTDFLLSKLLGFDVTISWLTQAPWNFVALILADTWQWTPFMFVILLAGLTSIPPHLYEAAELDGASGWRIFRYITLPYIGSMITLALAFRLLDAVKLFDTIFMMTGGGPGTNTYTSSFYLYQLGFQQFHLGQATAGSWIFLVFTALIILALVRRLLRAEVSR
jgi:multiple sugar transport system permease protein